tara:strand:- start:88 stop:303 length:216 start_codon:yes stop_codon:yes gene_type:complete
MEQQTFSEKTEKFCIEMGEQQGDYCMRLNVTREIAFDYGDINVLLIILILMNTITLFYVQWKWLRKALCDN